MATAQTRVISLLIDDQVFKVNKDLLCEYSDYFRAMFSGNYIEQEKQEISIDVVDANSMNIIIRYMTIGFLDLAEFSLPIIGELAVAAIFLQITELVKQIEYCLELQLSMTNWVEIMTIAENASFSKLEERSAAYGLYNFVLMKPEFIQPVHKLVWYLSHTHLNAESELHIFKFGLNWILQNENGADALLLIIGCLDMSRIQKDELCNMKDLMKDYVNSLAEKVVDCLHKVASDFELSVTSLNKNKSVLCQMYTERVFTEVLSLVSDSRQRKIEFKPCVALWSREQDSEKLTNIMQHYLYTIHDKKVFHAWLEVADQDLWGWNVVAWGVTKIVVVCGEHGRGTGLFWRGVKVYDVLKMEWIEHGVQLPVRRHGGVTILGDSLYVIGGVGGYRVVLDTAIEYNLKRQTYRKIARFPDAIQSPAVCVYDNKVYASGQKNIYCYEDHGDFDRWVTVLETDIRPCCMVAYKGFIYCTQSFFNNLYRFKPNVDNTLELVTNFKNSPSTLCVVGDKLLAFASTDATQLAKVTIEEYSDTINNGVPKVVWYRKNSIFTINNVAGSCVIVDSVPPINSEVSQYLKKYLCNYEACYSK